MMNFYVEFEKSSLHRS